MSSPELNASALCQYHTNKNVFSYSKQQQQCKPYCFYTTVQQTVHFE